MKRAISMVNRYFSREYIFLPTSTPTIIMTGIGRLVRLANHLGSIVHPGEGLVGGHYGKQVGEGADVVVGAPSGVLLLVHK
jgi:hypothetical protein